MRYIKAADVLPEELIRQIQSYVDGETLYIPRKESRRKAWGDNTSSKEQVRARNEAIFRQYQAGVSISRLAEEYYLAPKSIQKIISKMKLENA